MKTLLILLLSGSLAFAGDPIRPDPKLTPGAVLTNVTVEQITTKGYANVLNGGVRHVPESLKRKVFIAYFGKVPDQPGHYEVDHLISLELGGSNDESNLWPETYDSLNRWNAHVKDRLENWMAKSVRDTLKSKGHDASTALLHQYQHEISTDWIAAYRKYLQSPHVALQPPMPPKVAVDASVLRSAAQANFVGPPPSLVTNIVEDWFYCRPVHCMAVPGGQAWNTNEHWAWLSSTNGVTWKTNVIVPMDGMFRCWRETNTANETLFTLKVVP